MLEALNNLNAKNGDWLASFQRACTRFSLAVAVVFFLLISCGASAQNAQNRPKLTEQELDQQAAAANHKRKHYTDGDWFLIGPGDTFDLLTSNNRRYYLQVYLSNELLVVDIFRNDIFFKALSIGETTPQGESIYRIDDFTFRIHRFKKKKNTCHFSIEGEIISDKPAKIFTSNRDDWGENGWDEEDDDFTNDPFGHIMHNSMPIFQTTDGKLTKTENGWKLQFMLAATFENYEDEEVELELADAWVYVSHDGGVNWKTVHLDHFDIAGDDPDKQWALPTMKRKEPYSHWMTTLYLSEEEIVDQNPIIYFFGAKDLFGNISQELPETGMGYLPDTRYFLPAVIDENNKESVRESYDILDTYVGRDGEYLYFAAKMRGEIDTGSKDSFNKGIYAVKFSNPEEVMSEGLLVGKIFAYSPLLFSSPSIFDFTTMFDGAGGSAGRAMDKCIENVNGMTNSVLTARNMIYFKVKLSDICPAGCAALRTIYITAINPYDDDTINPGPENCSPFLYLFFRSHVIGLEVNKPITSPVDQDNGLEKTVLEFPELDYDKYNQLMNESSSEKQFIDKLVYEYKWVDSGGIYDISSLMTPEHVTYYHEGPGPFYVTPCDIVKYKNYTLQIYTRNKNLKARIFRDGELLHTIMINEHTKPRRDEQHKTGDVYITLSNFFRKDMSCTVKIDDLK